MQLALVRGDNEYHYAVEDIAYSLGMHPSDYSSALREDPQALAVRLRGRS